MQDRRECDLTSYEIRDVTGRFGLQSFNPSAVRNEPLINTSCPAEKMSELDQPFPSYPRKTEMSFERLAWLLGTRTDCIMMYVSRIP
jgi:hypothetical protein